MAMIINQVDLAPQDKIGETHVWRDWFTKVGIYLQKQQIVMAVPQYTTASLPTSPTVGSIVFDTTVTKFKVCEVAGVWKTVTTT